MMGSETLALQALIDESSFVSRFRACAESLASENASRLAAIQRDDKNITDLLADKAAPILPAPKCTAIPPKDPVLCMLRQHTGQEANLSFTETPIRYSEVSMCSKEFGAREERP